MPHPVESSSLRECASISVSMSSLSLNWKALSLKLNEGKVLKAPIKKKKKLTRRDEPKPEKTTQKAAAQSKTLLSPLAHALWCSENGAPISIKQGANKIAAIYDDDRKKAPGKYLSIDCEFVGVGVDDRSALARVSIVNFYGVTIMDEFVKPKERVTDWRTWVSGVSSRDMHRAVSFEEAQKKVADLLKHRVLVGHAVQNDLKALSLSHPRALTRDTSRFSVFREQAKTKSPALLKLALEYLKYQIHTGQHSSVEDAQVTMALFRLHMPAIERESGR